MKAIRGITLVVLASQILQGCFSIRGVELTSDSEELALSYSGASGTTGVFNTLMSIAPSTLSNAGAPITNCEIKPSTTPLPAWASIDPVTCVISGVPNATLPSTTYTLVTTNSAGKTTEANVTFSVAAGVPALSFTGASNTNGTIGTAMNVTPTTLSANGASISNCSVSPALPAWASISNTTCVISGTPNAILSTNNYSVIATNSVGTSIIASITLSVAPPPPLLSYASSTGKTGKVKFPMWIIPSNLDDQGYPLTGCAIKSGTTALPSWTSIDATTCIISGTPTAPLSATTYTVVASNTAGQSLDATITLSVNAIESRMLVGGDQHQCFLDSDGSVKCWGDNSNQQINFPDAWSYPSVAGVTPATTIPSVTLNSYVPPTITGISAEQIKTCIILSGSLQCMSNFSNPTWKTIFTSGVTAVASGPKHTCAIVNGALKCFGDNTDGQIGNGSTGGFIDTPYTTISSGVTAVSAGPSITCAVVSGVLKCFGTSSQLFTVGLTVTKTSPFTLISSGVTSVSVTSYDHLGAVVNGSLQFIGWDYPNAIIRNGNCFTNSSDPYTIINSGVSAVSVGNRLTCGIVGGALKCKGWATVDAGDFTSSGVTNECGATGIYTPFTSISSGVTDVIASNYGGICAIVSGSLMCWGENTYGQVGNGSKSTAVNSFYTVFASGVTAAAKSDYHTCAVVSGALKCFGNDTNSTVHTYDVTSPVSVPLPTNYFGKSYPYAGNLEFKPVAVGYNHTCVIETGGSLKCFGGNEQGQIGNGTSGADVLTPYTVFSSGVTSVAAFNGNTCAIVNGSLQCWGSNENGKNGNGITSGNTLSPNIVFSSGVSAVTMNSNGTCAVVSGSLQCWMWGPDLYSQFLGGLGNPTTIIASGVTSVAMGNSHMCAVVSGALQCWGEKVYLGLGINNNTIQSFTTPFTAIATGVTSVSIYGYNTCAVVSGVLKCFGPATTPQIQIASNVTDVSSYWCAIVSGALQCSGSSGQMGYHYENPIFASGVTAVSSGISHCCAIVSGELKCFGLNYNGQLGLGNADDSNPTAFNTPKSLFLSGVSEISSGSSHTCAIISGALKCIGKTDGSNLPSSPLTTVFSSGVTSIASGDWHTCAVVSGSLKCFGDNSFGQTGQDPGVTSVPSSAPVTVITSGVQKVFAASGTTCALKTDLSLWCFGDKSLGLFNDGDDQNIYNPHNTPTQINLPSGTLQDFSMSFGHACGIFDTSDTKKLYCWGSNSNGEIKNDSIFGTGLQNQLVTTSSTLEKVELGAADLWGFPGRTCVIDNGALSCFGSNQAGEIDSSHAGTDIHTPFTISNSGVTAANAKNINITCYLKGNEVRCTGQSATPDLILNSVGS